MFQSIHLVEKVLECENNRLYHKVGSVTDRRRNCLLINLIITTEFIKNENLNLHFTEFTKKC